MDIRCICPPKADGTPRHDHDSITLREKMGFRESIAIRNALGLEANEQGLVDMADVLAILTERFIRYGISGWTLVDDKGKPVDVTYEAIDRLILSDVELAIQVGDAADELYREAVMLPLLQRGSTSSPATPTSDTISRRTARSTPTRRRSSPSSISVIPTAGTAMTSQPLDGVSRSLPRSASAG